MARGKRTGRQVAARRGYVVRHWTAADPNDEIEYPYTVSRRYGFGDLATTKTLDEAVAAIDTLPAMRIARIEFEAYIPVEATEDEIDAWVSFELHENGSLSGSNPLSTHGLEGFNVCIGRIEEVQ